jgi:hypothetical protein
MVVVVVVQRLVAVEVVVQVVVVVLIFLLLVVALVYLVKVSMGVMEEHLLAVAVAAEVQSEELFLVIL